MFHATEHLAVRLEREHQAKTVRHDEQHGQAHAQLLRERGRRRRVGFTDGRGHQQGDGRQKQQASLQPGVHPVELLHVMLESAEEEGRAQHEQRVGDNGPGDGGLHQHVLPGAHGGERDDQFGQVPQRGVEQAADRIAGFGGHGFGGMTQEGSQRDDGQDREQEEQRVRCGLELLGGEHDGNKRQQPEQRVVTDFCEQKVHGQPRFPIGDAHWDHEPLRLTAARSGARVCDQQRRFMESLGVIVAVGSRLARAGAIVSRAPVLRPHLREDTRVVLAFQGSDLLRVCLETGFGTCRTRLHAGSRRGWGARTIEGL